MSWDISAGDLPDVVSVEDIPDDFQSKSLGPRSVVIARIVEIFPSANFDDPSWGLIDGDGWSIEVNIGTDETCNGFMLHVRGGEGAIAAVQAVLDGLGIRAVDCQTGEFFSAEAAEASFADWSAYRDQVVTSDPSDGT